MWCLFGFHGNDGQINGVTGGRRLRFLGFFQIWIFVLQKDQKQHLAIEIHKIVRIHCEVVSIK